MTIVIRALEGDTWYYHCIGSDFVPFMRASLETAYVYTNAAVAVLMLKHLQTLSDHRQYALQIHELKKQKP